MSKHYAIATDYDYNRTHKRHRVTIWSGAYCSDFEGQGDSLPNRDGYSLTMNDGRKLRVACPCPRTQDNFVEVDLAITLALEREEGR